MCVPLFLPDRLNNTLSIHEILVSRAVGGPAVNLAKKNSAKDVRRVARRRRENSMRVRRFETYLVKQAIVFSVNGEV